MQKKFLPLLLLSVFFISCKYDLLPEPDSKGNTNAAQFNTKKILPPENVTASHGNYRSVTLTWEPVNNATQYLIFSADTEFDTFEKKGETKGTETSFTLQEPTGVTKAYYVKSVDYYGNISRPSYITKGSSLSVPIITDISKNQNGDIYTLNWWMTNCSEDTYENLISYTINCYEDGVNTPTKIELPGNITSYDLTTLKQSTIYKFTIEAYKTGTKQKHEISDTEPIETGHRIVPDAAKEFTATQGTSTSEIKLSFKLPSTIESSNGDGTYEKENPVYFTLKRKAANESNYTTIYDYIGFNSSSKYATGNRKKILTGTYAEGQTVEITDNIESDNRGRKYSYVLQSYTDVKGATANINLSSDVTSVTTTEGWTLAPASFKLETENRIEEDTITNIAVTFHMNFDSLDIPYSYYLTAQKYTLEDYTVKDGDEAIIKKADSIEELDEFKIIFNSPENQKGYYEYTLYITERTDSETLSSIIYATINSPTKVTVTDAASELPKIKYDDEETFHVEDGYSNKFILSWNKIEDCSYILSWQNKNGDAYTEPKSIGPFTTETFNQPNDTETVISDFHLENGKMILSHSATSGEIRSYTLTAIKGLSNSCEKKEDFYTLGTAKAIMQTPSYNSITVVWDKVQKAKNNVIEAYKVEAKYAGSDTDLVSNDNCRIKEIEENKIQCVITKPEGFDDATKSGKTILLNVTTKGEIDSTVSTDEVYTLGPANLNVTKDPDLFSDHINITWNKVEGAKGYLVYRVIKNNSNQFIKDSSNNYEPGDVLYVTSNGVYSEGSKISSAKLNTTAQTIQFTDSYEYTKREDANLDALKKHQIQLTWGLPISYTVVPVLDEKDISFKITNLGISANQKDNIPYKNLSDVITSTFGYGLNVKASKAESNTEVTIEWEQPYNPENLIPKIYRRKNASSSWEVVSSPSGTSAATMSETITYGPNETSTYEYAVVYNNSEFDKTYIEKLESEMDDSSPTELNNKGYTLSLPQGFISAESAGGFKEKFSWEGSTYDFTKRNIGPDFYEIQMLNKNKATGWTAIAKIPIDKANNYKCTVAENNTEYQSATQVKYVSSSSYQAIFEPIFNSDNITTGQMQVLRDYKHYYRLVAVKMKDTDRAHAITAVADIHNASNGTKETPYTIRGITGEEFVKMGLLQYSYAINEMTKGGWWMDATKNTTTTDHGTWKILKDWGKIYYRIDNYNNTQKLPYKNPETNTNEVSKLPVLLTTTSGTYNKDSCVGRIYTTDVERAYTNSIYPITITLTVQNKNDFNNDSIKSTYEGSFTFYTPKEANNSNPSGTLKNGKEYLYVSSTKLQNPIECTNSKQRRKWLPLCMEGESTWYYNAIWENVKESNETTDTKFFWWEESSQGGN